MHIMVKKRLHILVVDDEPAVRVPLAEILEMEGHTVVMAGDGREAIAELSNYAFDVILTDLKMPQADGLEVLAAAGEVQPDALVILLTAYGTLQTAISALRRGAFDYLLKPASSTDILASIERAQAALSEENRKQELLRVMDESVKALRGSHATGSPQSRMAHLLSRGGITLDLDQRLAKLGSRNLSLTPTEFDVLALLMSDTGRAFTSEEILKMVKGYTPAPEVARAAVRVYISRLRQKIEADPKEPLYLMTVRGSGYMFCEI
jgi:DNA-binding response OmpR family regulator